MSILTRRQILQLGIAGLAQGLCPESALAALGRNMRKRQQLNLWRAIDSASASTSLQFCLDAGAITSYSSGQTWTDLTSNGYNFTLGATTGSSTDDATYVGTAGRLGSGNYFRFDGGDYFTTTNTTFYQSWHKDGAQFSVAGIIYINSAPSAWHGIIASSDGGSSTGCEWAIDNAGRLYYTVVAGLGSCLTATMSTALPTATPVFIGLSVNENGGAGASFIKTDTTVHTFNGAYTSPSAGSSSYTAKIGCFGNVGGFLPNLSRLYGLAAWNRALSQAEMESIRKLVMSRL